MTEASNLTSVVFEFTLRKKYFLLVIITDRVKQAYGKSEEWAANADVRLDPESIGKVCNPDDNSTHNKTKCYIANEIQAYLYLANQDRSAWTWELDLRPAHEKW